MMALRFAALAAGVCAALSPGPASAERDVFNVIRLNPGFSGSCVACNFSGGSLPPGVVLRAGADFTASRFVNAKIAALRAEGVVLRQADFSYAELPAASFAGTTLQRARFHNTAVPNGNFAAAVLEGADFSGARLPGADFESAIGLTQRQLDGACGDARTRLPRGLRIAPCAEETETAQADPAADE